MIAGAELEVRVRVAATKATVAVAARKLIRSRRDAKHRVTISVGSRCFCVCEHDIERLDDMAAAAAMQEQLSRRQCAPAPR